jgi:acetoin:2,6-dichlorophenolindophenol oxidoreductase subunit alpha
MIEQSAVPLSEHVSIDLLRSMHRTVLTIRVAEETIADLVESGEIRCPCHLYIGQEAIAAGVCAALQQTDYVWGGHRSHGHYIAKGGDLNAFMAEMLGKSTGCSGGRGGSMHLFAPEVGLLGTVPLVSATIPLAVGAALAARMRKEPRVSVAFFGDGAVEEGHFHESMNLAAVYRLPVLFVCENNLYASHMSLLERRAQDNIWRSAEAHGMPGVVVDGNDVEAVYTAAAEFVTAARKNGGPALLECRTYRWRGHVGASWDMDVGVKRSDELQDWLSRDPLAASRRRLISAGVSEAELAAEEGNVRERIDAALRFARSSPFPNPEEVVQHVYREAEA